MKILISVEREAFDFPPIFNSVERERCFDFPTLAGRRLVAMSWSALVGAVRSNSSKISSGSLP